MRVGGQLQSVTGVLGGMNSGSGVVNRLGGAGVNSTRHPQLQSQKNFPSPPLPLSSTSASSGPVPAMLPATIQGLGGMGSNSLQPLGKTGWTSDVIQSRL